MGKDSISRRDFVRLGAGAVAMGALLKTTILEPNPLFALDAPGEKIRFASVGMGVRGCDLLKASLLVPNGECVAIADLYDGRLRAGREILQKDVPVTRNYKELLDRKDIDAVIVAIPDHQHRRVIEDACAAGKDVYCEKPMSHGLEDGFAMVDAAKKNSRILQIGSQRVSSVVYVKAREIFLSGKLGDVCFIQAHSDRNTPSGAWVYPIPPDASEKTIDWDAFLVDAPKRPFDAARFFRWRCFADYGEGLPGDLFVHLLSGIQYITGTSVSPQSAYSIGGTFQFKDGRDFPDLIQTLYQYPDFQATLRCNQNNEDGEVIALHGTKGTLIVSGNTLTFKPQDTRPRPEGYSINGWPNDLRKQYLAEWAAEHPATAPLAASVDTEAEIYEAPPGYNDTADHIANFFNSIRTRKPPVENEDFGNTASIACHMANHSFFNKSVAVWNSATKKIKA
jgi:predicted dehydrogenase